AECAAGLDRRDGRVIESAAAGETEVAVADAQGLSAVVLESDSHRSEECPQVLRIAFPRVSRHLHADASDGSLGHVRTARGELRASAGLEDFLVNAGLEGKDGQQSGNGSHHCVLLSCPLSREARRVLLRRSGERSDRGDEAPWIAYRCLLD